MNDIDTAFTENTHNLGASFSSFMWCSIMAIMWHAVGQAPVKAMIVAGAAISLFRLCYLLNARRKLRAS